MRDPHVERLRFTIGSEKGSEYDNPKPLEFEHTLGHFRTEEGVLLVEPVEHFPDEATARSAIEPFLKNWEIGADLGGYAGAIRFRFLGAEVVDRNPPPPGGSQHITLAGSVRFGITTAASLTVTRRSYPPPPADFTASLDVVSAYDRWLGYRAGKEPLQSMAYFVYTITRARTRNLAEAARMLYVDKRILIELKRLASTKGDPLTARKAPRDGQFEKLTDTERAWLEQTVPKIIRRLGEHAAGAPLTLMRLNDLPPL